jgi:hypothetical protein
MNTLEKLYLKRDGPLGLASLSIDGFPVRLDPPSKWLVQNRNRARRRLQNAIADYRLAEDMIKGVAKPKLRTRKLSPRELEWAAIARSME